MASMALRSSITCARATTVPVATAVNVTAGRPRFCRTMLTACCSSMIWIALTTVVREMSGLSVNVNEVGENVAVIVVFALTETVHGTGATHAGSLHDEKNDPWFAAA